MSAPLNRLHFRSHRTWVLCGVVVVLCGAALWYGLVRAPVQRHINAGVQLMQNGQDIAAEKEWKKAVEIAPNDVEAWELLGDFYLSARNYVAALDALKHVDALAPSTPDLQARMAIAAYQLKQVQLAERYAQRQLKRDPDSIVALQTLAAIAADKPAPLDQLKYAQRLAYLQPNDAKALSVLADVREARKEYDEVLPLAERIVQLAPQMGRSYFRRGLALYMLNESPESQKRAQADFEKGLRLEPDDIEAHRYLGRVFMRLNQPRKAIEHYNQLSEGRPYATAHLFELSKAYQRIGDEKRAGELRERFNRLKSLNTLWIGLKDQLSRSPNNADLNRRLGLALLEAVQGDKAVYELYRYQVGIQKLQTVNFYLDEAVRAQPENAQIVAARAQLGNVYNRYAASTVQALKRGDYQSAREMLPYLVLLQPKDKRTLELGRQVTGREPNFRSLPR